MKRRLAFLRYLLPWIGSLLGILLWHTPVQARDVRVAFLVANSHGWKGDPYLRYIVNGDLKPMARTLKKLGFEIHTQLINGSAPQFRTAYQNLLQRLQQKPKVTTLFFYYTGHADKTAFHLGRSKKNSLRYKEFIGMLRKLDIKRRFVMLDACFGGELIRDFGSLQRARKLVKKGVKRVPVNISKYYKAEPPTRGIHIISSSSTFAFESPKHRGSVFTHHFLKGIRGKADTDKNGAISFQELFAYASREVVKETIQKPQKFIYQVGQDYPFAPTYAGRLLIPSKVTGHVKVVIGNFVWRHHKTRKRPLWLRVNTGRGSIEVKSKSGCQRKSIHVTRQRLVSFTSKGAVTPCQTYGATVSKGGEYEAVYLKPREYSPWASVQPWSFEVRAGLLVSSGFLYEKGDQAGHLTVGMRHRFGAISLTVWGTQQAFATRSASYLGVEARGELGYGHEWTRFHLFAGAFLSAGVLIQDLGNADNTTGIFKGGVTTSLAFRLSPNWSITLTGDLGALPANFGQGLRWFLYASVSGGIRFFFSTGS